MPLFPIDPEQDTICDVIRRWAEVQPDAPAILLTGRAPVNYGAFVERMDQVRQSLNDCGFGRGDRIGIVHSGGVDMAFLLFGITSGATAVPINPKVTAEELTVDFRQRGVHALVVEAGLKTRARLVAEQQGIPVIEATPAASGGEDGLDLSGGASHRNFDPSPSGPEDYFVVLLTSGTTEKSKVVPIRHRHRTIAPDYIQPSDRILVVGALYYSGRIMSLMKNLMAGSCTILAPSFEVADFWNFLSTHRLTRFTANQVVLKTILRQANAHAADIEQSRLCMIFATGGKVEPEIADEIEALFGAPVIERYASTETNRITDHPPPPGPHKRGSVGLPMGCEVRIRSLDGAFLPAGERGEVLVRGPLVFDGYENDPEANTEAFVDGWFRTGDEGCFDEDGYLTLTGRIKEMINRGGEKISPAEVDVALMSHPGVIEAAAFPIPHPSLGEEVAVAVVQKDGAGLSQGVLTKYLLERLSGFKVPRRVVFVDDVPKTEAGKVQRYMLAEELGLTGDDGAIEAGKPGRAASPMEHRLQIIWKRVLGLGEIGLDDNFFLLGGDSLKALELFLQIELELKTRLPAAVLFEAGTVAEMAVLIEKGEPQGCMVPIQTEGARPPLFCIHGAGGDAIGFLALSKHLAKDQPLYGIQSIGWDGTVPPFTRTWDMAAHYVAEMRKIQPQGPYYICGSSFGGRIAVYMANLLKQQGQETALLVLLDSLSFTERSYATLGQWLARISAPRGLARVPLVWEYVWARTRLEYKNGYDYLRRWVVFPIREYYRSTGKTVPLSMRRPDRLNRLVRLEQRHMPPFEGDAVYFKAQYGRRSMLHTDVKDSWKHIVKGKLTVIPVEGFHNRIIQEPWVIPVAKGLERVLADAREGNGITTPGTGNERATAEGSN